MKVTFVTESGSTYVIDSKGDLYRTRGEGASDINTLGINVEHHSPITLGERVNINHWPYHGADSILTTKVMSAKMEYDG